MSFAKCFDADSPLLQETRAETPTRVPLLHPNTMHRHRWPHKAFFNAGIKSALANEKGDE